MRGIVWTSQFKKDYKRIQNQGKDVQALKNVVTTLAQGGNLPAKYKDHPLRGRWKHHHDCHIQPDWILIYRIEQNTLFLERTGFHSDLFM